MASTGPDIKKAYDYLFNAANMMPDGMNQGMGFRLEDESVNFKLLGPATLHVVKTSFRSPNFRVDIIFDRTRVPSSFSQAEEIESLALAAARALLLVNIRNRPNR